MSELQIERDSRCFDAERVVHRIGVVLMTIAVIAGALGFFGYGPVSTATRSGSGYAVTYDRFARNGAEFTILLRQTDTRPLQGLDRHRPPRRDAAGSGGAGGGRGTAC